MRARTLGYIVAAFTPFWLLALLAIQGRFFVSPHNDVEYGTETSQKILAYSAVLRYTANKSEQLECLDPAALDDVSARWVKYYREGYLTSIAPITPEDDGTYGFREEIECARKSVLVALTRDLNISIKAKDHERTARRISQLLEVASVAKYNSAFSTFFASSAQIYALNQFEAIESQLSPADRLKVYQSFGHTDVDPETVRRTAERLCSLSRQPATEDETKLPTREQFAAMLTTSTRMHIITAGTNSKGALMAESYRVAFKQETHLQAKLDRYRLTALKMNSEPKSHLPGY